MPRIIVVVNRFPVVSESFLYNKVMHLRAAGADVTVVAHDRGVGMSSFADHHCAADLDFVRYSPMAKLPLLRRLQLLLHLVTANPLAAFRLWGAARSRLGNGIRSAKAWAFALPLVLERVDVIHFEYSGLAVSYLDALPLLQPARLYTSCRGSAERILPAIRPKRGKQLERLFDHIDRVHCVSAEMEDIVRTYGARVDQTFVNHPAIDTSRFERRVPYEARPDGPFRLMSVGRMHWAKGLQYGIMAVRHLVDRGYDVTYEIIGDGTEADALHYTIYDLGLQSRVRLLGRQPASVVFDRLEAAHVFLLPSLSEGISNAALEAMAMEIPVASTDVGGMSEAITEGREGYLVPPRDHIALADAVARMLDEPETRATMGRAGRERVLADFALKRQIERFLDEYRSTSRGCRLN